MDFPTILLIGVFVVIIAAAFPILAHMGPIPLEHDQPNDFESRLRESRARNAAGALATAGAQAGTTKVDLRKKKDQGDSGGGAELVTLGDSDSDGGSSCGGSGCGD